MQIIVIPLITVIICKINILKIAVMNNRNTLRSAYLVCCFLIFSGCVHAQTLIINTIAGNGSASFGGDGGLAIDGEFYPPTGIAVTKNGTAVYIADELNHRIRKVSLTSVTINTVAGSGPTGTPSGSYGGDGGVATLANLNAPFGVALDSAGNIYIADNQNYRIRKVNTSGIINTIAGTGVAGYTGDGTQATNAKIGYSHGITVDGAGNVYYSDLGSNVVRKIDASGIITTVAGNGIAGFGGDGGIATAVAAELNTPRGLRVDGAGNLYIADVGNNRIREVNTAGIISTVAGGGGSGADGIPATTAALGEPWDVALDAAGNIYITNYTGNGIREVDAGGIIHTIAHSSITGFSGDSCAAATAQVNSPMYLALDSAGNIYFSDEHNYRVRVISKNHAPVFAGGHSQSLTVCEDTGGTNIDTFLAASDADIYQPDTWTVIMAAAHGTAAAGYSLASTGSLMTPTGTFYTPATGYIGNDSFSVAIADCAGGADTTTIYVTVSNCSLAAPGPCLSAGFGLSVFPNPSVGVFTTIVASQANEDAVIIIRNVIGEKVKEIKTITNKPTVISLDAAPGIYFISATSADGTRNTKVIIR